MPAKPISVTLSERAQHALDTRNIGMRGNRSGTLAAMLERYARVCERCQPELLESELNLVRDALNGCWLVELPCSYALANIEDAISMNRYDQKWGINGDALLRKLRALDEAGWTALVDAVERWWQSGHDSAEKNGSAASAPQSEDQ